MLISIDEAVLVVAILDQMANWFMQGSLYIDKLIPTWHYKQKWVLNELINGVDNLNGLSRWNPSMFSDRPW